MAGLGPPGVAVRVLDGAESGHLGTFLPVDRITAPMYRPIRRILPDFGGLDFSPIVVVLIIIVLDRLLTGAELDLIRSGSI